MLVRFPSNPPPSTERAILYGAYTMIPHLPRAGHCDSLWMGFLLALDLWSSEKR